MRYDLRAEYQVPCVEGVREAYRQKCVAPLLVAPCGSGKTVMFSYMAENAARNGKYVLVMAHRDSLCTQAGEKMMSNGVDFGYINPQFTPDYKKRVQVGTILSIQSRMAKMYRIPPKGQITGTLWIPDLIIIDEARRSLAPTYLTIIQFYKELNPNLLLLGVDASPARTDKKHMGLLFDRIVMGPSVRFLIDLGYLVEPLTFIPEQDVDLSNVEVSADGELNKKQLNAVMNKPQITGDAVRSYTKNCPGVPAVVFCVSVKHAVSVAEQFQAAGYRFEAIYGDIGSEQKKSIDRRLRSGELQGITSVELVTDGYDAPMLECAILLRPTLSGALAVQMPCRTIRPYTNPATGVKKKFAYILDHAGISKRHGYVDDPREYSLDPPPPSKRKKRKEVERNAEERKRQCMYCYVMYNLECKECPNCGRKQDNSRQVKHVEGELVLARRRELPAAELEGLHQMAAINGYDEDWVNEIKEEWEAVTDEENIF